MHMQWLRACALPNVLCGHSSSVIIQETKRSEKENPKIGTDLEKIQNLQKNAHILGSAYSLGIGKLNLRVNQLKVTNEKN